MKIAVLKEKRDIDGRVILLPDAVNQLVGQGHTVLVEKDAGKRIYISNEEYKEAGAKIVKNPFSADIIVKIRAPLPAEFRKLRKGTILMSFLHINSFPQYAKIIRQKKCKAIIWELIKDKDGKRLVGVSRIAGELGMLEAFRYVKKIPEECKVLVLGAGEVGSGAIQTAMRLGANVQILGRSKTKNIGCYLPGADIVANCMAWDVKRERKRYLITRRMLPLLNKGAVIADLDASVKSPIETAHPTFLDNPTYVVDGVTHFCLYSLPALAPLTVSKIYSKQALPIVSAIANNGFEKGVKKLGIKDAVIQ